MRSMTGYGQAVGENERHRVTVSIKTVNHRYFDLALRLPESHREQESLVRRELSAALLRGRIEARVEIEELGDPVCRVEVRRSVAEALAGALAEIEEAGIPAGELRGADLLRLPELLRVRVEPGQWRPEDGELLLEVLGRALSQVTGARRREGESLAAALAERLDGMRADVESLRARMPDLRREAEEALRARLDDILKGAGLSEERVAQEVALLAERADVGEELDRLEAHLGHLRQVLSADGAIGRRLDFLAQEVLRELNTLGAKCRDAEAVRLVLDAKVLCEQLREQIQNIE